MHMYVFLSLLCKHAVVFWLPVRRNVDWLMLPNLIHFPSVFTVCRGSVYVCVCLPSYTGEKRHTLDLGYVEYSRSVQTMCFGFTCQRSQTENVRVKDKAAGGNRGPAVKDLEGMLADSNT